MYRGLALALAALWVGTAAQNDGDYLLGYANYTCTFGGYPPFGYTLFYRFVGFGPTTLTPGGFFDIINFSNGLPLGPRNPDNSLLDPAAQYIVFNISDIDINVNGASPSTLNVVTTGKIHAEDPPFDNITTYIFHDANHPRAPEAPGGRFFVTSGCNVTVYAATIKGHAKLIGYDGNGTAPGSLNGPVDFDGPFSCEPKPSQTFSSISVIGGTCSTSSPTGNSTVPPTKGLSTAPTKSTKSAPSSAGTMPMKSSKTTSIGTGTAPTNKSSSIPKPSVYGNPTNKKTIKKPHSTPKPPTSGSSTKQSLHSHISKSHSTGKCACPVTVTAPAVTVTVTKTVERPSYA